MGVKLKDWVSSNTNVESMRKLNYNMSKTMKYIHKKGYCIKYPKSKLSCSVYKNAFSYRFFFL